MKSTFCQERNEMEGINLKLKLRNLDVYYYYIENCFDKHWIKQNNYKIKQLLKWLEYKTGRWKKVPNKFKNNLPYHKKIRSKE